MAKKKVLTPEEMQVKLEKKTAKRNLFFGTFTKALAFFLAVAIAWSLAAIAFTPIGVGTMASNGSSTNDGGTSTDDGSSSSDPFGGSSSSDPFGGSSSSDPFGGSSSTTPDAGTSTTPDAGTSTTPDAGTSTTPDAGTQTKPDAGTQTKPDADTNTKPDAGTQTKPDAGTQTKPDAGTSTGATKADVVSAINAATAKAAKASYTWTRSSYYTRPLDVTAKDTLNKVIGMVDTSGTATVESVVGGFLDITGEGNSMTANVANGQLPAEGMNGKDKFLLIASKLTEGDVANFKVDGNKYMVLLPNCTKPQKDGSNALSRVTNDFITCDEVNEGLVGAGAGSLIKANDVNVTYKDIIITAEIVDGKLTKYDITYTMDVASMDLKALGMVSVGGSGAGKLECTYSDFKY